MGFVTPSLVDADEAFFVRGHGIGWSLCGRCNLRIDCSSREAPQVFLGLQMIGIALLLWYGWLMWIHVDDTQEGPLRRSKGLLGGSQLPF